MNKLGILITALAVAAGVSVCSTIGTGFKTIPAQTAIGMAASDSVTIIDVRSEGEYAQGHLKKAHLMPVSELSESLASIANLKEKPILVYCHSGNRSASASSILARNGFTHIYNLEGVIGAWESAGGEVTTQSESAPATPAAPTCADPCAVPTCVK